MSAEKKIENSIFQLCPSGNIIWGKEENSTNNSSSQRNLDFSTEFSDLPKNDSNNKSVNNSQYSNFDQIKKKTFSFGFHHKEISESWDGLEEISRNFQDPWNRNLQYNFYGNLEKSKWMNSVQKLISDATVKKNFQIYEHKKYFQKIVEYLEAGVSVIMQER